MKIKLPIMVQDPLTARTIKTVTAKIPVEFFESDGDYFLNGPVTEKIAILDFEPETGKLREGAVFKFPEADEEFGSYENLRFRRDIKDFYSPKFMQVSVFSTVLRILRSFEKKETLGHSLKWAFDSPQILVVPDAGEWANAYYQRASNSLQFFSFDSKKRPGTRVYTCLSRDIVAHETGHAIIDGIAPDLLDSCTPQSLAIHEALADITAVLSAFESRILRTHVLVETNGSIKEASNFTIIAEEFGDEIKAEREGGLRSLTNTKNFDPKSEDYVSGVDPHDLSEVLSGALYSVMVQIHEDLRNQLSKEAPYVNDKNPRFTSAVMALKLAARRFKRMVFRALDYLPPGNISFADYARALMAVDYIAYPEDGKMRKWVSDEFLARSIIKDTAQLTVKTNFKKDSPRPNISDLLSSGWAAYDFANNNRPLLCIPSKTSFEVLPMLAVKKKYDKDRLVNEYIFKVAWEEPEENPIGSEYPKERLIKVGTTLVFDESGNILCRLTNMFRREKTSKSFDKEEIRIGKLEYEHQLADRNNFLRQLVKQNLLTIGGNTYGLEDSRGLSNIPGEVIRGYLRVRSTGRMLHMLGRRKK